MPVAAGDEGAGAVQVPPAAAARGIAMLNVRITRTKTVVSPKALKSLLRHLFSLTILSPSGGIQSAFSFDADSLPI